MKIIFDFGCNIGQNFNYFLLKADIVVGVEPNKELFDELKKKFKKEIETGKLYLENVVLDKKRIKNSTFYISKKNSLLCTIYPHLFTDNIKRDYLKVEAKFEKASNIVKKYLHKFQISEIEYIKIDTEGNEKDVLEDLFSNKIYPKYLSAECQDPETVNSILFSPYKSFKFIKGKSVSNLRNIKIKDKNLKNRKFSFNDHSSGPYGDDIKGSYYDKKSILVYFLNNNLGWVDINCRIDLADAKKLTYSPNTVMYNSFSYHLKNIFPSFYLAFNTRFFRLLNFIKNYLKT
jgi:FkbM family methyltransferase